MNYLYKTFAYMMATPGKKHQKTENVSEEETLKCVSSCFRVWVGIDWLKTLSDIHSPATLLSRPVPLLFNAKCGMVAGARSAEYFRKCLSNGNIPTQSSLGFTENGLKIPVSSSYP